MAAITNPSLYGASTQPQSTDATGSVTWDNLEPFLLETNENNLPSFGLFIHEGTLIPLEITGIYQRTYKKSALSLQEALIQLCQKPDYGNGQSIKEALNHPSFAAYLPSFIEKALSLNGEGIPFFFTFSNAAALDTLEVTSGIEGFTTKIAEDHKRQYLLDIATDEKASYENAPLLLRLKELFPDAFLKYREELFQDYLMKGFSPYEITDLIDPKPPLSPFSKMQLQIAFRDKPDEHFYRKFDTLPEEKKEALYEIAYVQNNPFLYQKAINPVPGGHYSINLMWISDKKIPPTQKHLFEEKFVTPVANWAKMHPESTVNIWFDSKMTHQEAIDNSHQLIKEALADTPHGNIKWRDVREINRVEKVEQEAFEKSRRSPFSAQTPVYFRVDLLRALAMDHLLTQEEAPYCVYADIDMPPISSEEIFDQRTLDFLADYGIVFAKGGHNGFENGFQILSNKNPMMLASHREVIIEGTLAMALEKPLKIKEQQIYDTYPIMLTHFLIQDGRYGPLASRFERTKFRYDDFFNAAHSTLPLGEENVQLKKIVPSKPVVLPRSHF